MPRQKKVNLDYFYLDCDIFSKKSDLRPLLRKFKADGLAVFIHILCDVYGTGYYFKPDDYEGYLFDIAEDCGITVEKVQLILTFMTDRTLLDAFSLDKNTVFTSHGIQKHYAEAMKGRKRSVAEIRGEYWLLSEKEEADIDTFYKSHPYGDSSVIYCDNSEKNEDNSEIYATKEIKGNKTKEKEIKENNEVSKKEEKRESYDEIFEALEVGSKLKAALIEFIRHLRVNGVVMINSRLERLIISLDIKYGRDEDGKCGEIRRAITNGYKRLECEGD